MPEPHPDFPSLLLPAPVLPPFNRSTPASVYRALIAGEFSHAWGGYERDGWPHDDYHPCSRSGSDSYGMHLVMVDALDTLLLLNLSAAYGRVRGFLASSLRFGHQENINVFETTIRILGALLASYHLTDGDAFFLNASVALADQLLHAFASPHGIPFSTISLASRTMYNPSWSGGASTMAELGSMQLEFQYLSRISGSSHYEQAVDAVMMRVRELGSSLYTQFMNMQDAAMQGSVVTLGARVDSLYEYMLKQWLLDGKGDSRRLMRDMWIDSGRAIVQQLLLIATGDGYVQPFTSAFLHNRTAFPPSALLFVAEKHGDQLQGKMDHLACFLPGVFALSAYHRACASAAADSNNGTGPESPPPCSDDEWLLIATELMRTCCAMYDTETGLAPEIVQFSMRTREQEQREWQQREDKRQQDLQQAQQVRAAKDADWHLKRAAISENASMPEPERMQQLHSLNLAYAAETASLPPTSLPAVPPPVYRPSPPFTVDPGAKHSLLRPETVESLFVLWRVTGHWRWREQGWRIFSALVRHARVDGGGYSGLHDVTRGEADRSREREDWATRLRHWAAQQGAAGGEDASLRFLFRWSNWNDNMESFFLSETMKYLHLLFCGRGVLPIDRFVFNTEAHPLPVSAQPSSRMPEGYKTKKRTPEQPAAEQQPPQQQDAAAAAPVAEAPPLTQPAADSAGSETGAALASAVVLVGDDQPAVLPAADAATTATATAAPDVSSSSSGSSPPLTAASQPEVEQQPPPASAQAATTAVVDAAEKTAGAVATPAATPSVSVPGQQEESGAERAMGGSAAVSQPV